MTSPSGRQIVRRITVKGTIATTIANVIGGILVFVLLAFVLPSPEGIQNLSILLDNLVYTAVYGTLAVAYGTVACVRDVRRRLRWLLEERPPTRRERRATLRIPLAVTARQFALWVLAALLFGIRDGLIHPLLGVTVFSTIMVAGLTNAAISYLLIEQGTPALLPRLFQGMALRRRPGAGVAWRTVMVWGLGTGVPIAGISLLAGLALAIDVPRRDLALAVFVLALTALAVGLLTIVLFARGLAAPLRLLRQHLARIERGELDIEVPVTATTEVGVLQAGVNRMVEGLRQRRHLRELFGLHVGEDVAQRALDDGVKLGGERRDVAALFIDVSQSTALAQQLPPEDLVTLLNDLFGVVVEVVDEHGGLVNKFIGDAALAVWGAPLAHPDPKGAALRAAVALGERLPRDVPTLDVGIGVAAGPVVAGNLGADRRLEYTVIGDAVNIASRLSSAAKAVEGRVLAEAAMIDGVSVGSDGHADGWVPAGDTTLRGRVGPTPLIAPAVLHGARTPIDG